MNGRGFTAAGERNKGPILAVLERVLPPAGLVLEIASGAGQHVVHFAAALPGLEWQPSEADPRLLGVLEDNVAAAALDNVRAPIGLDVHERPWPVPRADAVVCINMVHIAPWSAAEGLITGAGEALAAGGVLYLYGPFRRDGRHTAPSNAAFDADLRARDPEWGVRDLEAVEALAYAAGMTLSEIVPMPANNLSVIFHRASR